MISLSCSLSIFISKMLVKFLIAPLTKHRSGQARSGPPQTRPAPVAFKSGKVPWPGQNIQAARHHQVDEEGGGCHQQRRGGAECGGQGAFGETPGYFVHEVERFDVSSR